MALPNTIIIGAQKAGTSSLYDWISQHPEVYGDPSVKDYPFFSLEDNFSQGLETFSKMFNPKEEKKVILHGSVSYIYFSELSAKRLYEFNPNIKLILILRNPVDRAYSAFWQAKKMGIEALDTFEEALAKEEERLGSNDFYTKSLLTYVERGMYSKQLSVFLKYFTKMQIKVIIFEELLEYKQEQMKDIYSFLEIDNNFVPFFKKVNEAGMLRYNFLNPRSMFKYIPKSYKKHIPHKLKYRVRSIINSFNIKKEENPKINQDTSKYLYNKYLDDINKLEKILEKDLSIWRNGNE